MRVHDRHLGYCTNIHPGERVDELAVMLERHVAAVKARVCPDAPFGLGLRLGNAAAAALDASDADLAAFAARLDRLGLYVFTVNAFPFGDFAAARVKAGVYAPSWLDAARVEYTARVARVTAALPGPAERTISTVAGCFRPTAHGPEAFERMARNLGAAARGLADLADATGVFVRLCLEPEPWTTLETADEAIELFTRYLQPLGEHARAHLALCYDCCHQAVQFEPAGAALARLADAGVPVGKVQVSSALHLGAPADADARAALLRFDEPRYLHQIVACGADGTRLRALDLPDVADADARWRAAAAWRCHFHVPIWWAGDAHLSTTRAEWEAALRVTDCPHLEVETYTWHVIPPAERAALGDLHDCVASELEAVRAVLAPTVAA